MKKITVAEARKLLELGIHPKCEVSRDVKRSVTSLTELQNLENLSGVQGFILWGYEDSEIESFKVPDNALPVSLDEAANILNEDISSDYICLKVIGKEEIMLHGANQLRELFNLYKKYKFLKVPFLLYYTIG